MDRRERFESFEEVLLAAMHGLRAGFWTSFPGIVDSYDAEAQTCRMRPAIQEKYLAPNGTSQWVTLPLLLDVPVIFPSGGGYTLTFPIAPGDEALVVIADRCIDAWWSSGKVDVQAELRMHDLSDGFAFIGPRSRPRRLTGVSETSVQLRSDDGLAYVEIEGGHIVNITAPGGINLNGNVTVTGTVVASGEGTFNGGHTVSAHHHTGVTVGVGNSGGPVG